MPAEPSTTEIVIPEDHKEFSLTGLKRASVIRLDKIATVSKSLMLGEIGEIGEDLREEINRKLREIFRL